MAKGIYLLIVFFLHAVRIITICIRAYHNHGLSCIFFCASSDFLLYLGLQKIHLCSHIDRAKANCPIYVKLFNRFMDIYPVSIRILVCFQAKEYLHLVIPSQRFQ